MNTIARITLGVSLGLILLLSACSSIPAGTIRGTLVDGSGDPVKEITLQLLEVTGQNGDELTMETTAYKTKTDEKGTIAFADVEPGKYVVLVMNITFALGGNPPSMAEMVIRDKDGKVFIFEVLESKGIDLGELARPKANK